MNVEQDSDQIKKLFSLLSYILYITAERYGTNRDKARYNNNYYIKQITTLTIKNNNKAELTFYQMIIMENKIPIILRNYSQYYHRYAYRFWIF